jgi:hypothetical protein
MRHIKLLVPIFIVSLLMTKNVIAQQANATMAVLPANSGQVPVNEILSLEITVGNTGPDGYGVGRLRPTVTVPGSVTFLATGLQDGLPSGWTILTNTGSQIRFCNSSDPLGSTQSRTIFLKVRAGAVVTPPQTFLGQINFGNGACANGPATPGGNNLADDAPTSTIEVVAAPLPLTLISFDAALKNCEPLLNWITESEVNSKRFEIQQTNTVTLNNWNTIGTVLSTGVNSATTKYTFTDKTTTSSLNQSFYRLKIIDIDDSYKYSKTISVNRNCETKSISVFPNPVQNGNVNINLSGYDNTVSAGMINSAGQTVKKLKLKEGSNNINVSELASGIYILKVTDINQQDKFVKVVIRK